jgi:serine/threonine-protein kinase RsbW
MAARESRYEMPGVLEQVQPACDFVAQAAQAAGLDEREVYHCRLAVDEACTNIVEHGFGANGANHIVHIVCRDDGQTFTITILDDSAPFNPLTRPDPDPTEPIEDRKPGGWGVYFLKQVMDEVHYTHNGRYNQLTMIKRLQR